MGKSALIIIDMLNDFLDESGVLFCGQQARETISPIGMRLEAYRSQKAPVIYLQDSHAPDDPEFKRFPPHCVAGTWGSRIIDELAPHPDEIVIPKQRFSGFYNTNLDESLAKAGVDTADVVGVCTSICVMDTVGGLANREFSIRVPRAEVSDFDMEMHQMALIRMEKIYGAQII